MATKFIKSVADVAQCPKLDLPEVAIVGRSNAGKSSVINAWLGGAYAKVSQTPGKTELLNFFSIDEEFVLVDMPGYGYAAKGKAKREAWVPLVESYLAERSEVCGVILVVDGQRPWTDDENNLLDWLGHYRRPVIVVVNKIDRFNQKDRSAKEREMAAVRSKQGGELRAVVWASARDKRGIDDLRRSVFENFLRV